MTPPIDPGPGRRAPHAPAPHLAAEFARFYAAHRCRWAPANPARAYRLGFGNLYPRYAGRVSPEEFLAAMYDALGFPGAARTGLFERFDPDRYGGDRPPEEHFLSLFRTKLRGRVDADLARAEGGRLPRSVPAGGRGPRPFREQVVLAVLPKLVNALPDRERAAVDAVFRRGLSARQFGAEAGVTHKTVGRLVERGVRRLRGALGLGEFSPDSDFRSPPPPSGPD